MKTPKEKAKEMIDLFSDIDNMGRYSDRNGFSCWSSNILKEQSKQCASICCDLLMEQAMEIHSEYPELPPDNEIRFLEKVKQEIEKL